MHAGEGQTLPEGRAKPVLSLGLSTITFEGRTLCRRGFHHDHARQCAAVCEAAVPGSL